MSVTFDTSELNALAARLDKGSEIAHELATVAVRKTAANIKRDAKAFAPVDTGNLRSSIGYETTVRAYDIEAEIGPTVEYGHYVEEGTSRMAPAAYMGPAFDRNAWQLEQALGQIAGRLL